MENIFDVDPNATICWEFSLQSLKDMTNNFSDGNLIGSGAYGSVYKGVFNKGEEIAVKKLRIIPGPEGREFENELNNLMMAQHQNIVRLIGYCFSLVPQRVLFNGKHVFAYVEEKILCVEYLQGGSLDKHISDGPCGLDWPTCYRIITGVCDGINYLHNGCKDSIYHLDLKPANILLDGTMMPKIGDFGLSRLFHSTATCITSTVTGTLGYMPPEYINRNQITSKFDVFSLGVVIVQIMAGRDGYYKCKDVPSQDFIELVHGNWEKRLHATMSSRTSLEIKTCIKVALRCVETDREKRPTIAEIIDELKTIGASFAVQSLQGEFPTFKKVPYSATRPRKDEGSNSRSKQAFNLRENLVELDIQVRKMLNLIEADGDSFAKKAEMYYNARPELVNSVEHIYRMYRSLAERYDFETHELSSGLESLTCAECGSGELRWPNSPASSGCESDGSSSLTSDEPKPRARSAGFDLLNSEQQEQ